MAKLLAFILICILAGCCWYWFSHADEVDPNELPTSTYLSDKPEDIAAVKKRVSEQPEWPVWIFIIFMGSTCLGIVVPFGNVFSLITAIICCLILIVTGNYMFICLGVLLQVVLIPMGLLALGKSLL